MTNSTKNIVVMIYFIYAQYRNHWLKITQERSECDLMTNSVKFMQQTGQGVHHCQKVTVVFVININLMHSTYLINSLKVKASVENVHLWYKHKLAEVYAIHWYELHQWLSAADTLHFNLPLLQFADITDPFLSTDALFSIGFRPEPLRWPHI